MKYNILSADWSKMLQILQPAKNEDRDFLIDKLYVWATEVACEEPNTEYGFNNAEFSNGSIIGFVSYDAVPFEEELEDVLHNKDWAKLAKMADTLSEYEETGDIDEDTDAVKADIAESVDAYLAALPDESDDNE